MPTNLDSKFQIEVLRESGISLLQKKGGVKTLWALKATNLIMWRGRGERERYILGVLFFYSYIIFVCVGGEGETRKCFLLVLLYTTTMYILQDCPLMVVGEKGGGGVGWSGAWGTVFGGGGGVGVFSRSILLLLLLFFI